MNPEERTAVLRSALDQKDVTTLRAIASVPPFVTGAGGMHAAARAAVIEADPAAKTAAENIKAIDAQEEAAERIEEVVLQSAADLVDFQQADSFAAAAADAVAATGRKQWQTQCSRPATASPN